MSDHRLAVASFIVDVVGAGGTIIAIGIAIHLGIVEAGRFRDDAKARDEDRRAEELRLRKTQASSVSAVLFATKQEGPIFVMETGKTERHVSYPGVVVVTNASSLPVYDCKVKLGGKVHTVGFLSGGDGSKQNVGDVKQDKLNKTPVEVSFRDSNGLWWCRHETGELTEHSVDPLP